MSEEFETETSPPAAGSEDATENSNGTDTATDMSEQSTSMPVPAGAPEAPQQESELGGPSLSSVIDVPLRVNVEIGSTKMLVREVLQLNKGSVVPLDRMSGEPADILVNGRLIARGEVTVLEESLAVRIVELLGREHTGASR